LGSLPQGKVVSAPVGINVKSVVNEYLHRVSKKSQAIGDINFLVKYGKL
jgi:hypothetical protein